MGSGGSCGTEVEAASRADVEKAIAQLPQRNQEAVKSSISGLTEEQRGALWDACGIQGSAQVINAVYNAIPVAEVLTSIDSKRRTQFIHALNASCKAGKKHSAPGLGIVRLEYDYKCAPGDIDCAESFDYRVEYRVVVGLTFEVVQNWETMKTPQIEKNFIEVIRYFDQKEGIAGITGDCGFMMYLQTLARNWTRKPVLMSALAQLPAVTCCYANNEKIAVMTANGQSLNPMRSLIKEECAVNPEDTRYIFVGCEDVPGFEAVAAGEKVNVEVVMPEMEKKIKRVLAANPDIRCILMECTELPAYSDAVRACTGLPVYDAITGCNGFMAGALDNPRFGENDWQFSFDGKQDPYEFGQNLPAEVQAALKKKRGEKKTDNMDFKQIIQDLRPVKDAAAKLGIVRLDYKYPPNKGDIDHPDSFGYETEYQMVEGLTFEVCQKWNEFAEGDPVKAKVLANFKDAINTLVAKGVNAITGDCGFMMWLQAEARALTKKPIFMSSLCQLPAVTCAFSKDELVAVVTANGKTLEPMRDLVREQCGVDPNEKRFICVGCEDVDGFEAVALAQKVDVEKVTPGVVEKCMLTLEKYPQIRAFLFECTELPPYSDAVRKATGLPVYDSITGCNYFMSGCQDNPRFGLQDWQQASAKDQ